MSSVSSVRRYFNRKAVGCGVLLLLHYAMGLTATLSKSTTFDEVFHITSGYSYNRFGDFRMQPENGLLPQRWIALPLVFRDLTFPTFDQHAWQVSDKAGTSFLFFYRSGNDPDRLLLAGRAMNGLWGIALGLLLFTWMRRLAGEGPAWLTLVLWAVCPTFLSHAFLATSDIAAAFFFLAAVGSLWSLLDRLTWQRFLMGCLSMAGLFLSKFSAPIIVPIGLIIAIIRLLGGQAWYIEWRGGQVIRARWQQAVLMVSLAGLFIAFTWCSIWIAYSARYSAFNINVANQGTWGTTWESMMEEPDVISRTVAIAREHRFLPEAFLYGFLYTHRHSQVRSAFFFGEHRLTGWALFFPYCALAKTPTGTLLLLVAAALAFLVRCFAAPPSQRVAKSIQAIYQSTPLWVLFGVYWYFAITSHLNIGHRHILPTYGPMLMFAGMAAWWCQAGELIPAKNPLKNIATSLTLLRQRRWPLPAIGVLGCVMTSVMASAATWPNYLTFFNMPSGGPTHAWKKLVDSSLDWGQDLPSLRVWIDEERQHSPLSTPLYFSYFGTGDPGHYGIQATLLPSFFDYRAPAVPEILQPGIYCVSASMVQGVYTDFPGPWTNELEAAYRNLIGEFERFESAMKQQGLDAVWTSLPRQEQQTWISVFHEFEQLQFTRLTHFLRRRDPDSHVNHSILIYRVDANELDKAITGPPTDVIDVTKR